MSRHSSERPRRARRATQIFTIVALFFAAFLFVASRYKSVNFGDSKIDEIIAQDRADATALGVRGTPTLFVNEVLLNSLSQKALFDLVEKEIYK